MRGLALIALLGLGCQEAPAPAPAPPATEPAPAEPTTVKGLPPGPNQGVVVANCTGCHSGKLVTQNRMSRARWDDTITWMQETQNMWPLAPELRGQILDYLEAVQGLPDGGVDEPVYRPNPIW